VSLTRKTAAVAAQEVRRRGPRVLVVDDAEGIRSFLANLLESLGYGVDSAEDGRSALTLLENGAAPDLVLLDVKMPGLDGMATLERIRAEHPDLPVVMLSVVGNAKTIVEAMRLGAADYLTKPIEEPELERVLAKLVEGIRMERERRDLVIDNIPPVEETVWRSPPLQKIREVLEQIADTNVTVLIHGESGVGKEIIARAAHELSTRAESPFVKVNCAALPEDLLESELFGYEKGAFTGASAQKPGKFELAHTGTIFLDEIGEMSPGLQAKMLHVLQDGSFTRLGGNREIEVDVRVVSATNRPLVDMVESRTFREDLYFRLNVVNVQIPPLRDRREEIPELVDTFLRRYSIRYAKPLRSASQELLGAFERYAFPGNVRELENLIKRIVVLESERTILSELRSREAGREQGRGALQELLREIEATAGDVPLREVGRRMALQAERQTIEKALARTSWNRKQAAKMLGVSYKTLLLKIRECGLSADS